MAECVLFSGSANRALAEGVADSIGRPLGRCTVERFPDGETHVCLEENVRGREVVLVQPTCPPVNEHLVELLLLADACRRASAARVTAVVPYFGYGRADKRHGHREPIAARLVADLMQTAGVARLVCIDPHTPQVEGFFGVPVDTLTAIPILADAAAARLPGGAVIVAPDAGRVKMATRYADRLGLPLVVLHKRRTSEVDTVVTHVVGDVDARACLLVDDIVSTGGTVAESARVLCAHGATRVLVAASHAILAPGAVTRLRDAGVEALLTTDSVPPRPDDPPFVTVETVAPLLARAVTRLLGDGSLRDLS